MTHAAENQQHDPAPAASSIPGAGGLAVLRLSLAEFRCYPGLRLDLARAPVVLTGPNGAGKTNLLEALSFLVPGRGLRRARLGDVRRLGAKRPWAVAAALAGGYGAVDIGTGEEAGSQPAERERRIVHIDGRPAKGPSVLAAYVNALWLTPDMDRIFTDAPSHRRRFLDRVVAGFDPGHARRLAAYEHALRERARILRDARTVGRDADPAWCAALEERMAEEGVAIAASRRAIALRLDDARILADRETGAAFPDAEVTVTGMLEDALKRSPALDVEDRFRAVLAANRRLDGETGGASEGAHRSDMAVRYRAKDMPADQCSTGEQKALLLAIVLRVARLQTEDGARPPLLLLDEVVAHLDARRRAALFDELRAHRGQAWLTGTDEALFQDFAGDAQFFEVSAGALRPRPIASHRPAMSSAQSSTTPGTRDHE